jgi:hypothetical protein
MFDPITLGLLGLGYLAFKKNQDTEHGVLTPRREEIYNNAMEHLHDPERLVALSKEYDKHGLKTQAHLLRKRAELRSRPEALKKEHEALFERAMKSEKPEGILMVARGFEELTATSMAAKLRERAKMLMDKAQAPVPQAPEPAPAAAKSTNGAARPSAPAVIETTAEAKPPEA